MTVKRWGDRGSQFWMAIALAGCGQAKPRPVVPPPAPPPLAVASPSAAIEVDSGVPEASVSTQPESDAGTDADASIESTQVSACPNGMILVDTTYCPNVDRRCIDEEYSPQNKITICHKFATTQHCHGPQQRRRFCIDEYEYPNKKGAHPPWMVSWYDGQATCGAIGKRLCYESEWVSACEGPEKTPFPYGYVRDNSKCNIDNQWIKPSLPEVYSKDWLIALQELSRLDQSAPSGALPDCVSGYGVHDMTGNFDEWVTADTRHDDKSEWAALKGGAWGHVRNACRPVTTSHPPDFTYYFITFRCCKDAVGGESHSVKDAGVPEVVAADRALLPTPIYPPGPSATKVAREHWPRPGKSGN
jgi:hypothetical protein